MHSRRYAEIKRRYNRGFIRIDQLQQYVANGTITPEEYEEISGQPYEVDEE